MVVRDLIKFHKAVHFYKCVNNLDPDYLTSLFLKVQSSYKIKARTNGDLIVPKHRLSIYKAFVILMLSYGTRSHLQCDKPNISKNYKINIIIIYIRIFGPQYAQNYPTISS